ncbi:MAG: HNH endonuclease signature motif containing protein [Candidatus Krumholzibacteria bacterium]
MSDSSRFSQETMREVFVRQQGKCAVCGYDLNQLLEETAMDAMNFHHVIPRSAGGDARPDNCVVLCTGTKGTNRDHCHYRVHSEGRYRTGAVVPPDYYEYSHGVRRHRDHERWVKRMSGRFRT